MPQMKPINWIILFFMMNLIITFMNIKMYYLKKMNLNFMKYKKNNWKNKNWKW